ncbi:MAG: hypothetical protein H7X80_07890 [bacterium]|nr:hypothetical protein [Candidatus Kapabacteria bacterium]
MTASIRLCITALVLTSAFVAHANPPEGEITTIERYSLILYDFDSAEPGRMNQRILDDHVLPEINANTEISIAGYSDVVGQEEHNYRLALARATRIATLIRRALGPEGYKSLEATAYREEDAPYRYDLSEGRMFSRTVIITLKKRGVPTGN